LLSSSRLRAVIKEASAQFDVVLVDAPPVLGLADAPLIASIVNDVVLVIESGRTRTTAAQEAIAA
jgi:Mrp family chromosome partitioning ATPase